MPLALTRLFSVALVLGIAGAAHAASHAESLLQRMAHTMHTVNYEGLLLHVQGGNTRTLKIFHLYDDDHGERERLLSLDGPAREVLHENNSCTCIWPRARLVVTGRPPAWRGQLSAERFGETMHLSKFYDFSEAGEARVAGLSCSVIRLIPKDAYRHGYRLCIHESSAMLLRLEVLEGDERLEMSQFANLSLVPDMGEEALRLSTDTRDFRVVEESPMTGAFAPHWQATTLPPGYSLRNAAERRSPHSGKVLEHLIFTDGLSSVSVFIEPRPEQAPPEPALGGAMRRAIRDTEGFRMTAIGEAPEAAMRVILDGLQPVAP
ncbi:MAG TPA: hypothetical protein ENO16_04460 [Chromatiales bacterium]|nr:hypothetical protein [Chromatiales bacterium]